MLRREGIHTGFWTKAAEKSTPSEARRSRFGVLAQPLP
jgi:hypothetical protein